MRWASAIPRSSDLGEVYTGIHAGLDLSSGLWMSPILNPSCTMTDAIVRNQAHKEAVMALGIKPTVDFAFKKIFGSPE